MSLMNSRFRPKKQSADADAPKKAGATKYKVIDSSFVEAVTPRKGDASQSIAAEYADTLAKIKNSDAR